jgi:hypothetical protein
MLCSMFQIVLYAFEKVLGGFLVTQADEIQNFQQVCGG